MKEAIKEMQEAFAEKLEASKAEIMVKERKAKAHHRWLIAKENVRALEVELLDEFEMNRHGDR